MGQVILSLKEYEQLKKQANVAKEIFSLEEKFNDEVALHIDVVKGQKIFKELFAGSKFDNGEYEIEERESKYGDDIISYYIKATKKSESAEENEELPLSIEEVEEENNGN